MTDEKQEPHVVDGVEKLSRLYTEAAEISAQYDIPSVVYHSWNEVVEILLSERATLRAERDRLREALEFYAETDNWAIVIPGARMTEAEDDRGARARAALSTKGDGE